MVYLKRTRDGSALETFGKIHRGGCWSLSQPQELIVSFWRFDTLLMGTLQLPLLPEHLPNFVPLGA